MESSLKFRFANVHDAEQIAEIYAPIVAETMISFEESPPTIEEIESRIMRISPFYPWLVAEDSSGQIAGYAYAGPHHERAAYRWAVNLSVYVRQGHRGHGVAKHLYTKLFELLRKQNYFRAYAGIALPNDASVHLHESMGFQLVGVYKKVGYKLGKWHDVGWWELTLKEPESHPNPPHSIEELEEPLL